MGTAWRGQAASARQVLSGSVADRQSRIGVDGPVPARRVSRGRAWTGTADSRSGVAGRSRVALARRGTAGLEWNEVTRRGQPGMECLQWHELLGTDWPVMSCRGSTGRGCRGKARSGQAVRDRRVLSRSRLEGLGGAVMDGSGRERRGRRSMSWLRMAAGAVNRLSCRVAAWSVEAASEARGGLGHRRERPVVDRIGSNGRAGTGVSRTG